MVARRSRIVGVLLDSRFLWGLVLAGVMLRAWAYLGQTALWLDEILLARNILRLPLRSLLTEPLALDQVAPRGFLLAERIAVTLFGDSELALRFCPLLASVAGMFLFRSVAARVLAGVAAPVAVFLFAIGVPFIKFAAELKQYEGDATAAIALTLLAVRARQDPSTKRLAATGLLGFVIVWFSQPSVLMMGGLVLALGVHWLISREGGTGRALLVVAPSWAIAAIVGLAAGLRSMTPATRQFMAEFWAQGFLPLPIRWFTALRWSWERLVALFSDPTLLRYRCPAVFLLVACVGIAALWRHRRPEALLLLGPFVVCMAGAVAGQYPFRGRLVVCLLPGLLLAVGAGAEWCAARLTRVHPSLGVIAMAMLLGPPVAALAEAPPPYEIEHHRAVLGYLKEHRRPGDVVYVFPLSRIGTLYYGPSYGLQPTEWITGICDRFDTRAYVRDVDRFRGAPRLWLLTSGGRPFRIARSSVQGYLGTIGTRRDSLVLASPTMGSVSLELFDLSDPSRLGASTAEGFPVPPMPTDPSPGCRDWAQPGPADALH